ncbi:hypothetical protein [Gemmobacter aquaticus]|nr:hypothetical protein [Gemmobacter aquaticus]
MAIWMVYLMIAAGFMGRGRGFWRALQWPEEVGEMLASMCDARKGE